MRVIYQTVWLVLGWISLIIGVIGIFVPLLPTTPLILLAAYCFSRGSEKVHHWLITRPRFGPMIRDWEDRGMIRRPAKIRAAIVLVLTFAAVLVFSHFEMWVKGLVSVVGVSVLTFILSRPEK